MMLMLKDSLDSFKEYAKTSKRVNLEILDILNAQNESLERQRDTTLQIRDAGMQGLETGLQSQISAVLKGEEKSFQPLTHFQNLLSKLRKKFQDTDIDLALFSVDAITQVIELLNTYVEVFNILHKNKMGPEVNFVISKNFNDSVEEKIQDLDRLMINILEYVFLVRKIEDLDKDKIESAPSKAKLYTEYDRTIDLLMKRSRLISYLLKVVGKTERSQAFHNLSELLKQMPSKDKLTEAALVNHLVNPYADIQKTS
mgnify:CR=1 FL=1